MSSKGFTQSILALAIVALIAGLSAGQLLAASLDTEGLSGEIIIGLDLALTGKYADPYGLPMQRGFELAREEFNSSVDHKSPSSLRMIRAPLRVLLKRSIN